MIRVRLVRGPKATLAWEHETRQAAMRRVTSLTNLHSCDYTENGDIITVDASRHYTPKERRV